MFVHLWINWGLVVEMAMVELQKHSCAVLALLFLFILDVLVRYLSCIYLGHCCFLTVVIPRVFGFLICLAPDQCKLALTSEVMLASEFMFVTTSFTSHGIIVSISIQYLTPVAVSLPYIPNQ